MSQPSACDVALTAQLAEGARVLGLKVLDHVVVGNGEFTSLLEKGLMPASRPVASAAWGA